MEVVIRKEDGLDLALMGMAYSFKDRSLSPLDWWEAQRERAHSRARLLAPLGKGHNKFLRQIMLWVDIEAARCWWSEFDTYKVGTVAQSESTMHTLQKRAPTHLDFERGTPARVIDAFILEWPEIKSDVTRLKQALPEGYLQRRLVTMNYETVRQILIQRKKHRLEFWDEFITKLVQQLEHPEYVSDLLPAEDSNE